MFFTSLHCVSETSHTVNHYNPEHGRIETLVTRLMCYGYPPPPYRLLLGVMGGGRRGRGRGKKSGMRQILHGFTDIFAFLSS